MAKKDLKQITITQKKSLIGKTNKQIAIDTFQHIAYD